MQLLNKTKTPEPDANADALLNAPRPANAVYASMNTAISWNADTMKKENQ